MIGHGRSDIYKKDDINFKPAEYAEILVALLDSLRLYEVNAIGGSTGGTTLIHLCIMQPNRFKHVISIGAQYYYSNYTRELITSGGPDSANADVINDGAKEHGKEKAMLQPRQFWQFRKLYGDPSFTPDILGTIKAKWLIVQGDNDFIVPLEQALDMHRYIPDSHLWIFPNGGHLPYLRTENETDFLKRSTEFLMGKWDKNN